MSEPWAIIAHFSIGGSALSKIPEEMLQTARDADLVDILLARGYDLVLEGAGNYHLREHDSLKVSHTKGWKWFSQDKGGNAIDFLMEYENLSFEESVKQVLGSKEMGSISLGRPENGNCEEIPALRKPFTLEASSQTTENARRYLCRDRGLDPGLVQKLIDQGIIYEGRKSKNVIFIGKDREGIPRYAYERGTSGRKFVREKEGSQKEFSFSLSSEHDPNPVLHVFESPIDLLSYLTLRIHKGLPNRDHYLSLGGTSLKAIDEYLIGRDIDRIVVRTDNDEAGQRALKKIFERYTELGYEVYDGLPKMKDFNDELLSLRQAEREVNF